jgi:thiamine biosynthesis lipoprotein
MTGRGLRAGGAILLGIAAGAGGLASERLPAGRSDDGGGFHTDPRTKVRRQAYLMGTRATLATSAADRGQGLQTLERLLAGLEAVEAELSTWREDSQLSAVNRQPVGTPLRVPDRLCDLLDELGAWHRATGGAFDPAIGSLVAVWGLREGGRQPSAAELAGARSDAGLDRLAVQLSPCQVTRLRDVILDAGAFGKGAAIDRVAEAELAHRTRAWMIDLGGQVAVGGSGGEPWPVALAHPRRRGEAAVELRLSAGSLATSGGSVRDVEVGGRTIGHILDPRTGNPPSRPEAVTVWHPRALVADILSTALYVMGTDEGLAWAEARHVAACFLLPDPVGSSMTLRATPTFRERFLQGQAAE